jgi:carboxypeptidase PM20D1
MSHLDVVPAGDLSEWAYPPFDGHLDESFVWGRGTLDCKHGVMAILEGVERLRVEGFQPKRTILIALGHDEELGGIEGNRQIAEWMRSRRIRLHAIFDEGGCIFMEFPGLDQPAALIGIAEKGQLQVELQVQVESTSIGHASMPPDASAISLLAAAIDQLQSNPFPARIDGGLHTTLAYIGPEMSSLATRVAMANLWLSQPFVQKVLGAKPSGNALLRTTIAPTMISGGIAENVLPQTASATLNIRLLPGDTIEHALGYLRQTIDDQRVTVRFSDRSREASPVSPVDTEPFLKLHRTIREVFPDVVVAPFVLVGGTDTVHYTDLCENIYRFIPTRLSERDTQRFHGTDERIAIENYLDIVRYYHRLITSFTGS